MCGSTGAGSRKELTAGFPLQVLCPSGAVQNSFPREGNIARENGSEVSALLISGFKSTSLMPRASSCVPLDGHITSLSLHFCLANLPPEMW